MAFAFLSEVCLLFLPSCRGFAVSALAVGSLASPSALRGLFFQSTREQRQCWSVAFSWVWKEITEINIVEINYRKDRYYC